MGFLFWASLEHEVDDRLRIFQISGTVGFARIPKKDTARGYVMYACMYVSMIYGRIYIPVVFLFSKCYVSACAYTCCML